LRKVYQYSWVLIADKLDRLYHSEEVEIETFSETSAEVATEEVCRRLQQQKSSTAQQQRSSAAIGRFQEHWENRSLLQKEPWQNRSPLQRRQRSSSAITRFLWQENTGKICLFCQKSPEKIGIFFKEGRVSLQHSENDLTCHVSCI